MQIYLLDFFCSYFTFNNCFKLFLCFSIVFTFFLFFSFVLTEFSVAIEGLKQASSEGPKRGCHCLRKTEDFNDPSPEDFQTLVSFFVIFFKNFLYIIFLETFLEFFTLFFCVFLSILKGEACV